MLVLLLAWRNLWRNRWRTGITGAAIAFDTAILIVTVALNQGMLSTLQHNLTAMSLGEAQVHAVHYRAERKLRQTIAQPDAILAAAAHAGIDATARTYGAGLAAVGTRSAGAWFWGIDPAREAAVFELRGQLERGRFLGETPTPSQSEAKIREVVIGSKLAGALEADVGSELVAVVEAADGSIGNDLFRVVGVLRSVSSDVDRSAVLLDRHDFAELFATEGAVHEIALTTHGTRPPTAIAAAIGAAAGANEVMTWQRLAPGAAQMTELFGAVMGFLGIIFGLGAGAGVLNTMLMSTFDRIREFGVLKALGATPARILRDVAAEALVLGLAFSGLGALLGAGIGYYLEVVGLDLATGGDLMISGVAVEQVWKAELSAGVVFGCAGFIVLVTVLASLVPAVKAARLDPVVAMNEP